MDSLHDNIEKNGMTDSNGVRRTELFPVLIAPDRGYKSSKVTLTETEKQWVMTTIANEQGACKTGSILEAQVIRDSYLYLCGVYGTNQSSCPYKTMRGLLTNAFSANYLKTTPADKLGYAKQAYEYVFEQGNAFYPAKLLTARGWRITSSETNLGYKEAIVMNTHYDNGSTVRWITDSSYRYAVILTHTKLVSGGEYENIRNNAATGYTDSVPFSQVTTGTTPSPSNPGSSTPSNPGSGEVQDITPTIAPDKPAKCASILGGYCDDSSSGGNQVIELIKILINILTAGIGVLATIGVIFCGYIILTARDDEAQVSKAKKRLLEIVIGIIAWVLFSVAINLLLPKGDTTPVTGFIYLL